MAKFVMDGDKIFIANLNAHFDADVVFVVDVPSAGVADDVTIGWFDEERSLPEGLWQGCKSERLVEILAVLHHAVRVEIFCAKKFGEVVAAAGFRQPEQGKNIAPGLRPGIAEQMRGNRTSGRNDLRAIFLREARANECVERKIERTNLVPQSVDISAELVGGHVVAGAPEHARIFESQLAGALVRKINEASVPFAHGGADCVPSQPNVFK